MNNLAHSNVQTSLFGLSSAVFSDCQKYRYRLDRKWDETLPPLAFGMLNPSTADHERNDPTIERCERRARALGFGSLIVWNLFAFRATKPRVLREVSDPIGPQNDDFIFDALAEVKRRNGTVVVGWGTHGDLLDRHSQVLKIAHSINVELCCLGTTSAGQPRHPLYVSYEREFSTWLSS